MDRSRRAPAVGSRRVLAPCVLRDLNERQSAECAPVAAVLLRERCKDQSAGSARPEAARSTQHWEIPTRLWKELQVPAPDAAFGGRSRWRAPCMVHLRHAIQPALR